jgi:hypothetical protein
MKTTSILVIVALVLILLGGCAPGANELAHKADSKGIIAGFWRGLWNGLIAPVTFIISLFNPNVQIYEVHNNGGWYNFGFIFGLMIIFGGGAGGAQAKRSRR